MEFKSRIVRYQCGKCKIKCMYDCVKCDCCKLWFHSKCQSMSPSELDLWGNVEFSYICIDCRTIDGSVFDYLIGMERLRKAASTKNISELRDAVQREMLFKAELKIPPEPESDMPDVDVTAAHVIDNYVDIIYGDPIKTTGDGDCLFNAASILLTGNETLSICLRYHTCLNIVTKMNEYMIHPLRSNIQRLSGSYESACFSAAKLGCASSSWTILALADTISRPIRVIYPYANGKNDVSYQFLNTVFKHEDALGKELPILWYRMGCVPVTGEYYAVNHFCAVADTKMKSPVSTRIELEYSPPPTSPHISTTPISDQSPLWQNPKRRRILSNSSPIKKKVIHTGNKYDMLNDLDTTISDFDDNVNDDDNDKSDMSKPNDSSKESSVGFEFSAPAGIPVTDSNDPIKKPLRNNDRFLSNEEFMASIQETESLSSIIPRGTKNNVYITMDYRDNKANFVDDCGVWDSGTTVNQYFIVSESSLRNIFSKNGIYCKRKVVNNKVEYVPIQPQPNNIIRIHRYYATLKGNKNYKRRISIISEATGSASGLKMRGVAEYMGENNNIKTSHGNSKSGETYTRTDPTKIRKAAAQVGEKTATQIVDKIYEENSPLAPKSAKQVQDRLYYEKKKKPSSKNNNNHRKNLADDILCIIKELNENDFVQEVILTKNKPPIIILYHENQIKNIKANCLGENGSVIGVDRTFNLGKFFVTAMSYKNRHVINRKTYQYPIFLGPICIQWDGEQTSYQKFFNHVREKLGSDNVTFGSDDEKCLRNALKISFPNSTFLLCSKHLKNNITHKLRKIGTTVKTIPRILETIFNQESGLVFSTNDEDFAQREDNISDFFKENLSFKNYYEKHLSEKLKHMIYKPLRDKKITKLWTNNNAESVNNRLKQETKHTILAAPELIEKLSSVVQSQHINLRRALYGNGNFKLFAKSEKLLVDESVWQDKGHREKQHLFEKLLCMTFETAENSFIKSTLGQIKIKKPRQTAGKKPGQRKRRIAERTTTIKHK